jgi:hypothetical protein
MSRPFKFVRLSAVPTTTDKSLATSGNIGPSSTRGISVTGSKSKERRSQQRIRFQAPATVMTGQHSIAASTKDISERGLFFFTDARVEPGSEIDIVITLPADVGLPLSGMVCCHGRVVRSDSGGGQYGVAVQIDRLASGPQV